MAATGWLRGIVKEVPSGDTLVIMGVPKPGIIPAEKRITLASLIAPRFGRRDGSTVDDPFAWESREFLRKRCIGQPCVFRVDYTLENVPGREFGSVFIGDQKENVAVSVVANGWARVRGGAQQSPFYEELNQAEEAAKNSGLGMWVKDPSGQAPRSQCVTQADGITVLNRFGKGKAMPAVVEAVINGSMLRVTLLEELASVMTQVCGIQSPSMGRRGVPAVTEGGVETAASVAAREEATQPEPFAREAKFFTEQRVLNREVRVVLEGVDKFGNLFARVVYAEGDQPVELAKELVKEGLAKVTEWGLGMLSTGAFALRETEREAKQKKLNLWHNYVPPASAGVERSDQFTGVVMEVLSGDSLVVRDVNSGKEQRLNLSSIRAPRVGRRDERPEAWATEAKEFLRSRFIGKTVDVQIEYSRKPMVQPGQDNTSQPDMTFASILYKDKDNTVVNLAEALLANGLATAVKHRTDDARSKYYVALMDAEQAAQAAKKGLHSRKEPPLPRINDVSFSGSANRAKQLYTHVQRNGKMTAICEYVMSGHKLRLFIPKESAIIAFAPSGVRAPQRAPAPGAASFQGNMKAEPYGDEAYQHARELLLQREVEIEVDTVDKMGTFLGTLRIPGNKNLNFGVSLLENGLAKLHPSFAADRMAGAQELLAAQDRARKARLRVWENDAEVSEEAVAQNGSSAPVQRTKMDVMVTDVVDGTLFYIQNADDETSRRLSFLSEEITKLALSEDAAPGPSPREGSVVLAQFSGDGQWYRAVVDRVAQGGRDPQLDVMFLDYGNKETVRASTVKAVDPQVSAVTPLAKPAALAFLKVPGPGEDFGIDAANFLIDALSGGKVISAFLEGVESLPAKPKHRMLPPTRMNLTLFLPDGASSLQEEMLAAGLARLVPPKSGITPEVKALLSKLEASQEAAKTKHAGMWQYGDIGSDEEAEEEQRPKAWGKRR